MACPTAEHHVECARLCLERLSMSVRSSADNMSGVQPREWPARLGLPLWDVDLNNAQPGGLRRTSMGITAGALRLRKETFACSHWCVEQAASFDNNII